MTMKNKKRLKEQKYAWELYKAGIIDIYEVGVRINSDLLKAIELKIIL